MPSLNPVLFTITKEGEQQYLVLDTPSQYWVIPYDDIRNLSNLLDNCDHPTENDSINLNEADFKEFMFEHNLPVLCADSVSTQDRIDGALEFVPELLEVCEFSTAWSSEFVTRYEQLYNKLPVYQSIPLEINIG